MNDSSIRPSSINSRTASAPQTTAVTHADILSAESASALLQVAETNSGNPVDVGWAIAKTIAQCGRFNRSLHGLQSSRVSNEAHIRSIKAAAVYDQFGRSFCDVDVGEIDQATLDERYSDEALRELGDPDVAFILDLIEETRSGPPFQDIITKRDRLARIVSTTRSRWMFENGARLLLTTYSRPSAIAPVYAVPFFAPRRLEIDLASCRIFGGCGPGSLRMAELCATFCETQMDIDTFLRAYYGPLVVQDYELLAQTFVRWRGEGPRFYR